MPAGKPAVADELADEELCRLIITHAYALFHPDDIDRITHDHTATLETSESRITYRLRQGDGSYRWAGTCTASTLGRSGEQTFKREISRVR